MGIKHNYAASGVNDGSKQVSVDRWNEDHVITGHLPMPTLAVVPATPSDGNIHLYGEKLAGKHVLSCMTPTGLSTSFQSQLGSTKVAAWIPPGGSTTVPGVFGMAAVTATGTATARTIAVTNMLTRMTRLGYVSAATANAVAGAREAVLKYTTGAGGGLGGFFSVYRFGISDAAPVTGSRMFVGLSASSAAPTNVEPDTLINSVGVCQLSTSDNLSMYCAGSSPNENIIDLGASFPANTQSADVYELTLYSPVDTGYVYYRVVRLNTGNVAEGTFTSGLPSSSTLLCHQLWRTNNATALAVGLDLCSLYTETAY